MSTELLQGGTSQAMGPALPRSGVATSQPLQGIPIAQPINSGIDAQGAGSAALGYDDRCCPRVYTFMFSLKRFCRAV